MDLSDSLFLKIASVVLKFQQGLESAESLNEFLLFLVEIELEGVDFLTGDGEFVGFVLFELIDHGLIVKDEFFNFDIFFLIEVALGYS